MHEPQLERDSRPTMWTRGSCHTTLLQRALVSGVHNGSAPSWPTRSTMVRFSRGVAAPNGEPPLTRYITATLRGRVAHLRPSGPYMGVPECGVGSVIELFQPERSGTMIRRAGRPSRLLDASQRDTQGSAIEVQN